MADEPATPEITGAVETPDQIETSEETVSEDANTPTEESQARPGRTAEDYEQAMYEERRKRQDLEARLNDPDYVYERARALGLTAEEAQTAADAASSTAQSVQPANIDALVDFRLEMREAREKYPQLAKDEDDQLAVSALIRNKSLSPLKAAERYYAKFNQAKQSGEHVGASKATQTISEKERAATAPVAATPDTGGGELEEIRTRMRSYDRKTQEQAYVDLQLFKARNRNK